MLFATFLGHCLGFRFQTFFFCRLFFGGGFGARRRFAFGIQGVNGAVLIGAGIGAGIDLGGLHPLGRRGVIMGYPVVIDPLVELGRGADAGKGEQGAPKEQAESGHSVGLLMVLRSP